MPEPNSEMMPELKPCPFCGEAPWTDREVIGCRCPAGPMFDEECAQWLNEKRWNTRPIEDALSAQVKAIQADLKAAEEARDQAKKELLSKEAVNRSLAEGNEDLRSKVRHLQQTKPHLKKAGELQNQLDDVCSDLRNETARADSAEAKLAAALEEIERLKSGLI